MIQNHERLLTFSDPLQVQFLSSASGFLIKQYFEKGTQSFYETFNDKPQLVLPVGKQGTQIQREGNDWCIHILWVLDKDLGTKSKKVVNRIIPLIDIKVRKYRFCFKIIFISLLLYNNFTRYKVSSLFKVWFI